MGGIRGSHCVLSVPSCEAGEPSGGVRTLDRPAWAMRPESGYVCVATARIRGQGEHRGHRTLRFGGSRGPVSPARADHAPGRPGCRKTGSSGTHRPSSGGGSTRVGQTAGGKALAGSSLEAASPVVAVPLPLPLAPGRVPPMPPRPTGRCHAVPVLLEAIVPFPEDPRPDAGRSHRPRVSLAHHDDVVVCVDVLRDVTTAAP